MRPIVNVSEGDRATDTGNMLKNLAKIARVVPEIYALSMGKKTASRSYATQPIVNMSEDLATDTGNMHKKFGKDCTCGSGDILIDSQTDPQTHIQTHRQTYSSEYFATAPVGEVIMKKTHIHTQCMRLFFITACII